jgi:YD repeat-containing protein
MGSLGSSSVPRVRWAVAFALLLLVISAVPVLAEPLAGPDFASTPSNPPDFDPSQLPNAQDIAEGIAAVKTEKAQRRHQLNSPAATLEREDSQDAYEGLTPEASAQLLRESFEEMLTALDADPARYLSEEKLLRPLDQTAARVSSENGPLLLDSSVPLRTRDEEGHLRKVDLSLEVTEDGMEPLNPIIDLAIAPNATEGVEVGKITITQLGAEVDSSARPFEGQNAFFPEVQPSTDLLVSPTSTGVELFDQLRAAESPETLRFKLELPEGVMLEPSADGGAEVLLASGKPLGHIFPPTAIDAQGTLVPVRMQTEDSVLTLSVEHRDADFAYPILVDPKYQVFENWIDPNTNWYGGANIGELENPNIWGWDRNTGKITNSTIGWHNWVGGSNRGLFTTSTYGSFGPNEYGQWSYWVPDWDVYIDHALINPFWRNTNGCNANQYTIPAEYDGLWDGNQWNQIKYEDAKNYNWSFLDSWGKILVIGMSSLGGGSDPCYRDLYVGGVGVWMGDWGPPTLSYPTGIPSGWISNTTPFTISANSWDAGLGIWHVTITPQETAVIPDPALNCTGTRSKKCPENHTTNKTLNGSFFDEGETTTGITAEDPTGETSTTHHWTMRVDNTQPKVTLGGQLATLTKEAGSEEVPDGNDKGDRLSFPVYNLTIAAEDGAITANPKDKRSGVKDIEVFLDGKTQPEEAWHQTCPNSSCSMTQVFQLKLPGLAAGPHTLRVLARDHVNKLRERAIEFEYFPATGIKDEYVMQHFPLPDGKDHSAEEASSGPELAVNLMNGNLVYHERDVDIEGPAADLEVERFYNSQLPEEQNTEWGDGWTLAQTPDLEPIDTGGTPTPDEAGLLDESGSYDGGINLPAAIGGERFDPELQATVTKTVNGYELSDESGENAGTISFDQSGRAEELLTSGETTVDFAYSDGALSAISVDDPGSTDLLPNEVEEPEVPDPVEEKFEFASSFGGAGATGGKFSQPTDIAINLSNGNLFVADLGNHRIQVFGANGNYLYKFGDSGPEAGKRVQQPAAIAFSGSEEVYVADRLTNEIKVYNPVNGEFVRKFGGTGTAPGLLKEPEGIAVSNWGEILVSDSGNGRVQEFSEEGKFVRVVASKGTGLGQLGRPSGLDFDHAGRIWIADAANNRLVIIGMGGDFIQNIGSIGTGAGQFKQPGAVTVDSYWGDVHIGDIQNGRVQTFNPEMEFREQFGSVGSDAGQFNFGLPMGIAAYDRSIWITDSKNNRIQRWQLSGQPPTPEYVPVQDDPAVTVEADDGLVSHLEGERSGEHTYEHEGDLLIAHGAEGETAYEYDPEGRMTKVTLPNGTWGSIEYSAAYGRVKAVTVDPAGEPVAKTTHFNYSEEPRRTVVIPEGEPAVTYDIGADGSVLKWWNTQQPPDIDYIGGSLYGNRETAAPITGGDHTLVIQAHSEEGIAAIEVIANGNVLVDEKYCDQDPETLAIECVELVNEWVTNTANWAPGILQLEVLATDRLGQTQSERFWVNIPYTPPTPEGLPEPPEFNEVLRFREEFGLDLDLDPQDDELELNDRIFALIAAWHEAQTPLGQVARGSAERWGVPLRPVDVAEMMYREDYLEQDAQAIAQWAEDHPDSGFAGYYVDNRQGGVVYIGFKTNGTAAVETLKASGIAPASDRIRAYPVPPAYSLADLRTMAEELFENRGGTITQVLADTSNNELRIGAENVGLAEAWVDNLIGLNAPVSFFSDTTSHFTSGWNGREGPVLAGQRIGHYETINGNAGRNICTAGFGAREALSKKPNSQPIIAHFVLTAGHCWEIGKKVGRWKNVNDFNPPTVIGSVARRSIEIERDNFYTDVEAVRLDSLESPRTIAGGQSDFAVTGVTTAAAGMPVCSSGAKSERIRHGEITDETAGIFVPIDDEDRFKGTVGPFYIQSAKIPVLEGDSGQPMWRCGTGEAIGLGTWSNGAILTGITTLLPPETPTGQELHQLFPFKLGQAPGILNAPGMGQLNLSTVR